MVSVCRSGIALAASLATKKVRAQWRLLYERPGRKEFGVRGLVCGAWLSRFLNIGAHGAAYALVPPGSRNSSRVDGYEMAPSGCRPPRTPSMPRTFIDALTTSQSSNLAASIVFLRPVEGCLDRMRSDFSIAAVHAHAKSCTRERPQRSMSCRTPTERLRRFVGRSGHSARQISLDYVRLLPKSSPLPFRYRLITRPSAHRWNPETHSGC
jgi:hypothetical protein